MQQRIQDAKAVDLPIRQPTKSGWVINLKAAKTIGLTVPAALLLRADELIDARARTR